MAGRTQPEARRGRYTRDEDWQALAHCWKQSSELRQLFNDAFTVFEMTARDEKRIRETRDGEARVRETWRILESQGVLIEVPPIGPGGRRSEPVHFTLPPHVPRVT